MRWKVILLSLLFPVITGCISSSNREAPRESSDIHAEVRAGKALAARLVKQYGLVKNVEATRYINTVLAHLGSVSSRPEIDYHAGILNSNEIDAFSCPGGYILITKGALQFLQSEAELAGLLAHEMAHTVLLHDGDFSGPGAKLDAGEEVSVGLVDSMMYRLQRGRPEEEELDADRAAALYAYSSGWNPGEYRNYLSRLSRNGYGSRKRKSRHPSVPSRVRVVDEFMELMGIEQTGQTNRSRFNAAMRGL